MPLTLVSKTALRHLLNYERKFMKRRIFNLQSRPSYLSSIGNAKPARGMLLPLVNGATFTFASLAAEGAK